MKGTMKLIYAVLSVPIILLISLTAFQNFFSSSQSTFEQTITGELLGALDTSPKTFVSAYPAKVGSMTVIVKNVTSGAIITPSSVSIDYKSGLDLASVTIGSTTVGNDIKAYADYTAYAKEGYSNYVKTYRSAQSGFNLGALLPFVLIMTLVAGIFIGALAAR
jgi:hypothetical protein